jgi:DNA-3-methyladenine glycosylase I
VRPQGRALRAEEATVSEDGLIVGADGKARCGWPGDDPAYVAYHDREWGRPVADDRRLFEKLCLEGFQSGLSWRTILAKRENFRRAFAGFDVEALAGWGERRWRPCSAKPASSATAARSSPSSTTPAAPALSSAEAGSLAAFLWRFEPGAASRPARLDRATLAHDR